MKAPLMEASFVAALQTVPAKGLEMRGRARTLRRMKLEFVMGLLGGVAIGLGSLLATAATGRLPGISGVCARLAAFPRGDTAWRAVFLVGLVVGAGVAFAAFQPAFVAGRSLLLFAMAGVLVGLGTRLGGGCTSGHGVCGIGLGARDSLVATIVFMLVGMVTVFVTTHGLGLAIQ